MRIRLAVQTSAREIPWQSVLKPGRGLVYDALARRAPQLGRQFHEAGLGPYGMVPFGHGSPVFPKAKRVRGRYAAGGHGVVEFGSPLPEVVEALGKGLADREVLDWGGVALRLTGIELLPPPECSSGRIRLRTETPVLVKGSKHLPEEGERVSREGWLMPRAPLWAQFFRGNLARKARTLGLDDSVELESVLWVGAQRSFQVGNGAKPGAPVEVEISGAPETLRAVWSWGLGQANAAGFGWVRS